MFVDEARIHIESGRGGNGCASFRREKFVAAGGPDGGDGGRGGSIYFAAEQGMSTLFEFRHKHKFVAQNGGDGAGSNCHGKDAEDLVVYVPVGTVLREAETGLVVADLSRRDAKELILPGGRGGKGNQHYATPTMQIPRFAQPGKPGKAMDLILELKLIADVGLLGFPNAGKSTFLSHVSNAKPKIAAYPFTTLEPQLGVVELPYGKQLIVADIPGLIEGAAEGIGLGHDFLRHLERTRVLIHLVDCACVDGRDPVSDFHAINAELEKYSPEMAKFPQVVGANKMDLPESETYFEALKKACEEKGYPIFKISAATGEGLRALLDKTVEIRDSLNESEPAVFEKEYILEEQEALKAQAEGDGIFVEKVDDHVFTVGGPAVEKMLGFTYLDTERGFDFFQRFLRERGIIDRLKALGIEEGDTVEMEDTAFEYYE